ncbi:hypothetical protein H6G36_03635 [Anabaena minutissima FACHB-250]|nr:hypothetical protein [Anabaena minutissima FACHB-250]
MEELEEKINFLMETVRQLERRVNSLEKLLKNENATTSDDESVNVTGAMNIPKIPKLALSEDEILEIYNNNSDALLNSAVKVSVTQASLLNKDVIFFEKTKSNIASYWVIATEDDNYWLLPKGNLRINAYNYETVNRLFECDNYKFDIDCEFILVKLAKVSLNQNREQWQLLEPGRLQFSYDNEYQEEISSIELETAISENAEQIKFTQNQENTGSNFTNELKDNIENNADLENLLVNIYNTKCDSLASLGTVVIEAHITIEELNLITNDMALFEKNVLGEYWLFSLKQRAVYLVPRRDRDISQDIEKIQRFFECRDYQLINSNKFQLIKPARVSPLNTAVVAGYNWVIKGKEKWQLQETGILQFG